MQDFQDPCPVNEQLRAKIVSRLIKEGSNANEPANIALSDYSSLSSGADTNDDDEDPDDDEPEESELNNHIDGQVYHNHRRGEARRKSRRLRSRRQRLRNNGGGLGGAQFNSSQPVNFFGDSRQVTDNLSMMPIHISSYFLFCHFRWRTMSSMAIRTDCP